MRSGVEAGLICTYEEGATPNLHTNATVAGSLAFVGKLGVSEGER